jgi:hypothetical protein
MEECHYSLQSEQIGQNLGGAPEIHTPRRAVLYVRIHPADSRRGEVATTLRECGVG